MVSPFVRGKTHGLGCEMYNVINAGKKNVGKNHGSSSFAKNYSTNWAKGKAKLQKSFPYFTKIQNSTLHQREKTSIVMASKQKGEANMTCNHMRQVSGDSYQI